LSGKKSNFNYIPTEINWDNKNINDSFKRISIMLNNGNYEDVKNNDEQIFEKKSEEK
jgi:hypothetical protein